MSILDAKSAPEGVVVDDPSEHIMSIEDKDNIYLLEEGFVLGLVAESIFISLLVSMLYCFWKSMRSRINKQYDEVSSDGNSRV